FRRAAEASVRIFSPKTVAVLQAYADGVNAWLRDPNTALPPEYAALNLTKASMAAWTVTDSEAISKQFAGSFGVDEDATSSATLAAFQQQGAAHGIDGTALYFEDVYRSAPFEPGITVPGFLETLKDGLAGKSRRPSTGFIRPETIQLARRWNESLLDMPKNPFIQHPTGAVRQASGSNVWVVSGGLTASGYPILASDPHQGVAAPTHAYEAYITVRRDPQDGPMRVYGVTYPGIPTVAMGCNDRLCWGMTFAPVDQTDNYQE